MIKVIFDLPNGETKEVTSPPYVETVMLIARGAGVPGIIGDCGGFMSCATCHVYVAREWRDKLAPQSLEEIEILSLTANARPESRLACQIWLTEALDGLRLTPALA